jgi:hypothetical protein
MILDWLGYPALDSCFDARFFRKVVSTFRISLKGGFRQKGRIDLSPPGYGHAALPGFYGSLQRS